MFRARRQLGKRQTADSGNGFRSKKFRTDQQVPTFDLTMAPGDGGESWSSAKDGEEGGASTGRFGRSIVRGQTGNVLIDCEIPAYGTEVERKRCRKAGEYVIGHELGTSTGVPQTQYLARKQATDEYYLLKVLSFDPETELVDKETLQGKELLHNEYSLLAMLDDLDGVIHQHGFFSDYAFEERQIENDDGTFKSIYTGRIRRRLMLVLDCVHAHEFCERSGAFISLQRYISITKYTELEALQLFYEVVKVVEQVHARNIIHRDLKLNNIVLNRHTKQIVLTNFFLGKQLINEQEVLFDQRGSPAYISPDVLGRKPYKGKPSDIWALGVILYTIIYGKFPFLDTTPTALFRKIRDVDYVIPAGFKISDKTNTLIKSMLTLNPEDRLTATEVRMRLDQMLRKKRPLQLDHDQLVPEISACEGSPSSSRDVNVDQSTPNNHDPLVAVGTERPNSASLAPTERMEVDVSPASAVPPASPKYELSTEPFSRVLESTNSQQRQELGSDGLTRPKNMATTKKITTTVRFTPLSGNSTNGTGMLHQAVRSLSPSGTPLLGGAVGGAASHRNRFNFNLNVQYSARSYNSAARAVAAVVAAVRGRGAITSLPAVECNDNPVSANNNQSPPLRIPTQTNRPVRTGPSSAQPTSARSAVTGLARPQANTSPLQSPQADNVTGVLPVQSPQALPPAAQRLYAIMNYISLIRGQLPAPSLGATSQHASPLATEGVAGAGLEFNGIVTQEIADKIVPYLIVNLRHHEWVVDLFRAVTGGASDPDQRVNNLLELLRQLGVRMEARNGQIVIRAEQTRARHQFLGVLLRIAGFNDNYFAQQHPHPSPAPPLV